MLITSGNDRVFGEMIKAQQMEERKKKEKEYRERKEREKREALKKEKEAKLAGKDVDAGASKEQVEGKEQKEKDVTAKKPDLTMPALVKSGETTESPAPGTPVSIVKHKDGEPIRHNDDVGGVVANEGKHVAIVAVPIEADDQKNADEKHEADAVIIGPKEGKEGDKKPDEEPKEGKKKDPVKEVKKDVKPTDKPPAKARPAFDPTRDIELLVKLMGPEVANLPMSELKAAFAALETAAAAANASKEALEKKDVGPVIWTWNEPCEKWRWRSYAAGCAVLEPGCWEERDWKVFADERGCEEFYEDEEWIEGLEVDVHDWSC